MLAEVRPTHLLHLAWETTPGEYWNSPLNLRWLAAGAELLRVFAANEIVFSTHPPGRSNWLEHGVVERARERFDLPITHVVVDLDREAETQRTA